MDQDVESIWKSEQSQAIVRLCIAGAAAVYILATIGLGLLTSQTVLVLLPYICVFFIVAVALFVAINRWRRVHHGRRVIAMLLDYGSITLVLLLGDEVMLPISATLIWITVGYGMRYGTGYLFAGTVASLTSVTATAAFSDFWRANPYLVAMLAISVLMVPVYASILLKRTRLAHEEAMAANRAKSQVLAQASHDLRQPIHAIGLFTNCLRAAPLGPDEQVMVGRIERSLDSISRLFRSLLDLSTLDSGRVIPRQEVVSLHDLLSDLAAQNSQAARWAQVDLRVVTCRQHVFSDPALLNTMVQNLITNAVKHAPGGPVLIGCRRRNGRIAIEVHDRGPGIPADHLDRIFDEFHRVTREGCDVSGVGLGLSIVRRMAALLQLVVTARSRQGLGSTLSIDGLQMAPRELLASDRTRRHPTPLNGLRVLLIEDDPEVLHATSALLRKWGCQVRTERTSPPDDCPTDLIIADFDLGEGDNGCQVIAKVRADRAEHVPAILITGHDAISPHPLLGDDTPVLSKPLRPAELRAAVAAQRLAQLAARAVAKPDQPAAAG